MNHRMIPALWQESSFWPRGLQPLHSWSQRTFKEGLQRKRRPFLTNLSSLRLTKYKTYAKFTWETGHASSQGSLHHSCQARHWPVHCRPGRSRHPQNKQEKRMAALKFVCSMAFRKKHSVEPTSLQKLTVFVHIAYNLWSLGIILGIIHQ